MSLIANRVLPARLPCLAAAVLAAVPLLTGGARAGQVTMTLDGKVSTLAKGSNPNAELQLAAEGVSVGTPASLEIVIESTTPGVLVDSGNADYMEYDMAVVDVVLSAGTWEAHFAPPPGKESTNFVKVTDNGEFAGFDYDSWDGTALGVDTGALEDNILSQGSSPPYGTFLMHFSNSPPVPSTGDGLVEDLKKYKYETFVRFFGLGGTLTVDFKSAPAGNAAAIARAGQLKAASKLGNSVLKGLGKFVAAPPEKDPFGAAKEALLQKASDNFGIQFSKAIAKALKKGGTAPLGESGKQDATDYLMQGLQAQSDTLTADVDTSNPFDRALRGKLLKALAAECHADFVAHAKDVKKPDSAKLDAALQKARVKLANTVGAAIDKATQQGVLYNGPIAATISATLGEFVDGFVEMTSTGVE